MTRSAFEVWRWPVAIAALTMTSLLLAFLIDSPLLRLVEWVGLATPLVLCLRCWKGARRPDPDRRSRTIPE